MSNLSELLGGGSGGVDIQEFTSSGTWTKPAGATFVKVEIWGAGGGGSTTDVTQEPSEGGGGGGYMTRVFAADDLGATEPIVIGAGGAGGAGGGANSGADGGNSTFSDKITVYGGKSGGDGSGIGGRGWGDISTGITDSFAEDSAQIIGDPPGPAGGTLSRFQVLTSTSTYTDGGSFGVSGTSVYGGGAGSNDSPSPTVAWYGYGRGSVYGGGGGGAGDLYSPIFGPVTSELRQGGKTGKNVAGGQTALDGVVLGDGGSGVYGPAYSRGGDGSYAGGGGGATLAPSRAGNGGPGIAKIYTW